MSSLSSALEISGMILVILGIILVILGIILSSDNIKNNIPKIFYIFSMKK